MAMKSYPERDRDIYNWFVDYKNRHIEKSYMMSRIREKLLEKYKIELSDSSISRIVKIQALKVELEQAQAANIKSEVA